MSRLYLPLAALFSGACSVSKDDEVTGPVATEAVYLNDATSLYSFDAVARTTSSIGTFLADGAPVPTMTDIGIDLDGRMFGGAGGTLYRIDPATASVTEVMVVGDDMTGLTFVSDGRLVGAGATVFFIDVDTNEVTSLTGSNVLYTTSGDIVGLPDGQLYWAVQGGDSLVRVDPDSGEATLLGSMGVPKVWGLGYADGDLLAFTSGGEVRVIDDSSGETTDSAVVGGSWYGAATNPVLW